jgi:glycosyltransferase involved in cell wall biosynthesis
MAQPHGSSKENIRLSVCIITQNEAHALRRALASVTFADEIIVVDGGSTDNTQAVVDACPGARMVVQSFAGFSAQRNRALKEARGQWVFFLDSDEEVTPALARRLRAISQDEPSAHPHCYSVRREEYFLGKHLKYGPGNPSHQWRFFKRTAVEFVGEVHEYPIFDGPIGAIGSTRAEDCSECINHWPDLGIDKFLNKMNRYTTLEALERFAQGERTSLAHAVLTFYSTFLKNGLRYGGLFNGREGLVLTILESFSRTVRHLKLWLFWQVHEKKIPFDLGMALPVPGSRIKPKAEDLDKPAFKNVSP